MPKLIEHDPLREAEQILSEQFYGQTPRGRRRVEALPAKPKPLHYRIVCISLYNEDIQRLEGLVAELKKRGHTKANKSAVIRYALDTIDLGKMPKGY